MEQPVSSSHFFLLKQRFMRLLVARFASSHHRRLALRLPSLMPARRCRYALRFLMQCGRALVWAGLLFPSSCTIFLFPRFPSRLLPLLHLRFLDMSQAQRTGARK
ncbi:hypothetical protein ACSFA7_32375 [Variovorax sp. LT1R20]